MAFSRRLPPSAHVNSPSVIGIVKKVEFQTNLQSEMKIHVCSKNGKILNGAPHNATRRVVLTIAPAQRLLDGGDHGRYQKE